MLKYLVSLTCVDDFSYSASSASKKQTVFYLYPKVLELFASPLLSDLGHLREKNDKIPMTRFFKQMREDRTHFFLTAAFFSTLE